MKHTQSGGLNVRRTQKNYFVYCIRKQEDGTWLLLNRNYKPVGFNTDEHLKYDDYPVSARNKGLGAATLKKLSFNGEGSGDTVYLYNDGCVPTSSNEHMKSYLEKLQILLKI